MNELLLYWKLHLSIFRVTNLFHFERAVRSASGTPVGSGKMFRTPPTIPSSSGSWASQTNSYQIGLKNCRGHHRKKPRTDNTSGTRSICQRPFQTRTYLQSEWLHPWTCFQHRRDFIEEFLLQINVFKMAEEMFWWKRRSEESCDILNDVVEKKTEQHRRNKKK